MPLINGMKMACEPCIRGHRSTKCTHASERLMVPVRKPGRPLSSCPHPGNQPCGCGSVTAAIPKKQTCHCGVGQVPGPAQAISPSTGKTSVDEPPSPPKAVFKVRKPPRPSSVRKQSFEPVHLERMDMNHVNLLHFEQRHQPLPISLPGTPTAPRLDPRSGGAHQYASIQPHYGPVLMRTPPRVHVHLIDTIPTLDGKAGIHQGGFSNGLSPVDDTLADVPLNPVRSISNNKPANGSCCSIIASANGSASSKPGNDGLCSASKEPRQSPSNGHSHSGMPAVLGSQAKLEDGGAIKYEALSSVNPLNRGFQPPLNGNHYSSALPLGHLPQTTLFTYPSTYGSFHNPLQPAAWRQGLHTNNVVIPQASPAVQPSGLPFEELLMADNVDITHACSCGEGCQCIGCAAHPYNDATQSYVRSAWELMEQPPPDLYLDTSGQPVASGTSLVQHPGVETISSPTAHTPSSTTSANGEEQSLSASDFFFVNYPFMSDRCGGDTQSCPCGEECQCLGCSIHHQPAMNCDDEVDCCPCGDECQLVGCERHKGPR